MLRTQRQNCSARSALIAITVVALAVIGCSGGVINEGEAPIPVIIKLPMPLASRYEIITKLNTGGSILGLVQSAGQIVDGQIRVDLPPVPADRQSIRAEIHVYPIQGNDGCASSTAMTTVEVARGMSSASAEIQSFSSQSPSTCLVDVYPETSSDGKAKGRIVSTSFTGQPVSKIDCGRDCVAHVAQGTPITFDGLPENMQKFSGITSNGMAVPNKQVTVFAPLKIIGQFVPTTCVAPSFCQDDNELSADTIIGYSFSDVWGLSGNSVWAVGSDPSNKGVVLYYANWRWVVASLPTGVPPLRSVWAQPGTDYVWVGGDSGALYTCKVDQSGRPGCSKVSVGVVSAALVSISGYNGILWLSNSSGAGVFYGTIPSGGSPPASMALTNISVSAPVNRIEAIDLDKAQITMQGGSLRECLRSTMGCSTVNTGTSCGTAEHIGIASQAGRVLVGTADGTLCSRPTGGSWQKEASFPASTQVSDVFLLADGMTGWAVGAAGRAQRFTLGSSSGLETPKLPMSYSGVLSGVWSGGGHTFLVGEAGGLFHYYQ